MNKQTKSLRKLGISMKVVKGASHPDRRTQGLANEVAFDVFKGKACITDFDSKHHNPQNKRKSPWEGARRRPLKERGETAE